MPDPFTYCPECGWEGVDTATCPECGHDTRESGIVI